MSLPVARTHALLRTLLGAATVTVAVVASGCSSDGGEEAGATRSGVVNIPNTSAKKQAIGNCWLFATNGLVESLRKQETGEEWDLSEAYLTYWDWYERLMGAECASTVLGADGKIETGADGLPAGRKLVAKYGLMSEADFVADPDGTREQRALDVLSRRLSGGDPKLIAAVAKHDGEAIRVALDEAWLLSGKTRITLEHAFGKDGTASLKACKAAGDTWCDSILDGDSAKVRLLGRSVTVNAALASYQPHPYPEDLDPAKVREWERVMQRALHGGAPAYIAWWVDGAAMNGGVFDDKDTAEGEYRDESQSFLDGKAGGHASLVVDYGASNVPGFGQLAVGEEETRSAALTAALDDAATVDVLRLKNSWGTDPGKTVSQFGAAGYVDLTRAYYRTPNTLCGNALSRAATPPPVCAPAPQASAPSYSAEECSWLPTVFDIMVPKAPSTAPARKGPEPR